MHLKQKTSHIPRVTLAVAVAAALPCAVAASPAPEKPPATLNKASSSRRRFGAGGSILTAAVCLTILRTATPAGATTLRRMDLPELVATADRIVHARVVVNRAYWDATHTQIFTDTDFEVLDEAKGTGPKSLTITQLGGHVPPIDMLVEGTPTFSVGEEVVLFTELHSNGQRLVTGLSQGVMRVHENRDTGEKIAVSPALTGVQLVGGKASRIKAPLGPMLERIRQLAAGGRKGATLMTTPAKDPVKPGGGQQ